MGANTKIEWTDATINFWHGCTKVSPGCDHCYAENQARRFGTMWGPGAERKIIESALHRCWDLHYKSAKFESEHDRMRRVFFQSMSDTFDNEAPEPWREMALDAIRGCYNLHAQLLTKRVGNVEKMVAPYWDQWPRHVGLMATVVNQEEVDRDVPKLIDLKRRLKIPWVGLSIEPILGPINLRDFLMPAFTGCRGGTPSDDDKAILKDFARDMGWEGVDWVIAGGESGASARAPNPAWIENLADQCAFACVAFFFKQWGEWMPIVKGGALSQERLPAGIREIQVGDYAMRKLGKAQAGALLDGRIIQEFPPALKK